MALSDVEISNLALSHIGQTVKITTMDDKTPAAEECSRFFDVCRDKTLLMSNWGFATGYWAAGGSVTSPGGHSYAYPVPNECLRVWRVYREGESPHRYMEPRPVFNVIDAEDGNKKLLVCNEPLSLIEGTRSIEDTSKFSADFVMALSYLLASMICMPLGESETMKARFEQLWQKDLGETRRADKRNVPPKDNIHTPDWIANR